MNNPQKTDESALEPHADNAQAKAVASASLPKYSHGRTGKVARLPKAIRDKINLMMLDGHTYLQIIAELGDDGKDLNEDNLSTWKSAGFLDFRREEKELADIRVRQEYAADVARETPGVSLCEATSKMMIAQVLDALRDAGPGSLQTALADKPEIYVRLLHAVARLSTGALICERHRVLEEERKAASENLKADPSKLAITSETI